MATKNNYPAAFEEHLTRCYGKRGTKKRTEFEITAQSFLIGEVIKEERRLAKLTQEQLAEKTGVKKSFISKIENGKNDIQLSTLYRLLEAGLGKKVDFTIRQHRWLGSRGVGNDERDCFAFHFSVFSIQRPSLRMRSIRCSAALELRRFFFTASLPL
ncbi:MAG: hypothetical protein CRN43_14860 [Candidatus Nephrothrix sp. EaCA]|nr:MAG: hypothetical protein CRN43_14860 [Candidatus Nephrothrix sp. EaCA]